MVCGARSGKLERGESAEVDELLDDYATGETVITFEQYKRGVRAAMKRHKKENMAMRGRGVGAGHLGR